MPVDCKNCPLRKYEIFDEFSDSEMAFMTKFKSGEMTVEPRTSILAEGSRTPQFYTALSGMGLRYKTLENGGRQVIGFVFPGDLIGLQASVMDDNGYSFESVTEMTLCVFNRDKLWTLFRSQPERAYDLTWLSAVEEHFLGEAIVSLGRRTATERICWAIMRIFERLRAIDLGTRNWVPFPYRQSDLADALGLSLVHTNKTLKSLARSHVAAWKGDKLYIHDHDKLAALAMDGPSERVRPLL